MDHTLASEKSINSLEDLAVHLTMGILSLMTLQNFQVRALELGIMKEDMNERSNTIIWDLRRLMKQYQTQLEDVLELLPENFKVEEAVKKVRSDEIRLARKMIKSKVKG